MKHVIYNCTFHHWSSHWFIQINVYGDDFPHRFVLDFDIWCWLYSAASSLITILFSHLRFPSEREKLSRGRVRASEFVFLILMMWANGQTVESRFSCLCVKQHICPFPTWKNSLKNFSDQEADGKIDAIHSFINFNIEHCKYVYQIQVLKSIYCIKTIMYYVIIIII